MTNSTTELTHSVRERLARALAIKRLPGMNLTAEAREMLIQQDLYHARADVETILAEMEKPSEGMIHACQHEANIQNVALDESSPPLFFGPVISAMIQHIRDGGS